MVPRERSAVCVFKNRRLLITHEFPIYSFTYMIKLDAQLGLLAAAARDYQTNTLEVTRSAY